MQTLVDLTRNEGACIGLLVAAAGAAIWWAWGRMGDDN